ncbi:hypothetical protein ACG7TL_008351 [Trametes sanguinea]
MIRLTTSAPKRLPKELWEHIIDHCVPPSLDLYSEKQALRYSIFESSITYLPALSHAASGLPAVSSTSTLSVSSSRTTKAWIDSSKSSPCGPILLPLFELLEQYIPFVRTELIHRLTNLHTIAYLGPYWWPYPAVYNLHIARYRSLKTLYLACWFRSPTEMFRLIWTLEKLQDLYLHSVQFDVYPQDSLDPTYERLRNLAIQRPRCKSLESLMINWSTEGVVPAIPYQCAFGTSVRQLETGHLEGLITPGHHLDDVCNRLPALRELLIQLDYIVQRSREGQRTRLFNPSNVGNVNEAIRAAMPKLKAKLLVSINGQLFDDVAKRLSHAPYVHGLSDEPQKTNYCTNIGLGRFCASWTSGAERSADDVYDLDIAGRTTSVDDARCQVDRSVDIQCGTISRLNTSLRSAYHIRRSVMRSEKEMKAYASQLFQTRMDVPAQDAPSETWDSGSIIVIIGSRRKSPHFDDSEGAALDIRGTLARVQHNLHGALSDVQALAAPTSELSSAAYA